MWAAEHGQKLRMLNCVWRLLSSVRAAASYLQSSLHDGLPLRSLLFNLLPLLLPLLSQRPLLGLQMTTSFRFLMCRIHALDKGVPCMPGMDARNRINSRFAVVFLMYSCLDVSACILRHRVCTTAHVSTCVGDAAYLFLLVVSFTLTPQVHVHVLKDLLDIACEPMNCRIPMAPSIALQSIEHDRQDDLAVLRH